MAGRASCAARGRSRAEPALLTRQVPLAFMDLFKFYPSLKNAMPVTNENVRTAFVVIFIPIRIVYWPYICSEFWKGEPCRVGGAAAAAAAAVAGGGGGGSSSSTQYQQ